MAVRSALAVLATLCVLVLVPAVAHACPSCFSGTEEGREAFFWTFVLLTSLPLAIMGAVVYWLFRRAKHLERERYGHLHDPAE